MAKMRESVLMLASFEKTTGGLLGEWVGGRVGGWAILLFIMCIQLIGYRVTA